MTYIDEHQKTVVDLFIAVAASSLSERAQDIRTALEKKYFRILFLHNDISLDLLPLQLRKANLPLAKLLPKLLLFTDWNVPERVIKAWADDSQQVLIANAIADSDALIVSNCALEKIEVPFNSPILCTIPLKERSNFEIDEDGSFIRWPKMDIDLDFDSLRYLVEPELRKKSDAELVVSEQGFGYAVRGVRELNNLTQTDIEARTGISERQLRRYETEGIKPRVSSLEKLARAHQMDLNTYLEQIARAVNGSVVIILPCKSTEQQSETSNWLSTRFDWLSCKEGLPLPVFRPKGSREHDFWNYDQQPTTNATKEQLGLAIRIESAEDFESIWSECAKRKLKPDVAVGANRWPSVRYIPATPDYVLNKLRQRTQGR